jgi:hypothetical protein
MRVVTWVFQVMPLFFLVGGVANAASWSAASTSVGYGQWVGRRLRRLLAPTGVFLATWIGLGALLPLVGVGSETAHLLTWLVAVPLWFLAVYVVVVALAPPLFAAHRRRPLAMLLALVGAAVVVDLIGVGLEVRGVRWLNMIVVYLCAQQLGFWWYDRELARRRVVGAVLAAGGLLVAVMLTTVGPYPVSMVGVPGQDLANNAPPTLALLALGAAQAGLAVLLAAPARRLLERPRLWWSVVAVNASAMTLYLWHFTALALTAAVVLPLGLLPQPEIGTAGWWASRPLWLATAALALLAIARVVLRFEQADPRGARRPRRSRHRSEVVVGARAVGAVVAFSLAIALLTTDGLAGTPWTLGLPLPAILVVLVGTALLPRSELEQVGERATQ